MYASVLYGVFRKLSFRSSVYYNIILLFLERNKAGPPQRLNHYYYYIILYIIAIYITKAYHIILYYNYTTLIRARFQVSVLKRRVLNSAGKQTSDSTEIARHDVCLYETIYNIINNNGNIPIGLVLYSDAVK